MRSPGAIKSAPVIFLRGEWRDAQREDSKAGTRSAGRWRRGLGRLLCFPWKKVSPSRVLSGVRGSGGCSGYQRISRSDFIYRLICVHSPTIPANSGHARGTTGVHLGWTPWDAERQVWEAVAPSFLHRVLRLPQVAVVGSGFQPSRRRRRTRPEAKEMREVAADRRREAERGRDAHSGAEQRYLAASHPILLFFFSDWI